MKSIALLSERYRCTVSTSMALCLVLTGVTTILAGCQSSQIKQAKQFVSEGRLDDAVELYRKAARQDPFNDSLQEQFQSLKIQAAALHYEEGKRLLMDKRMLEALHEFKLAIGFDPSHPEYHLVLRDALRLKEARDRLAGANKFRDLGRLNEAMAAYQQAVELDPDLTPALDAITALTHQQRAEQVAGKPQPVTLRFQNTKLKEAVEILARTADMNVVFDKDIRDEPVTVFIKDKSFEESLNLILTMNGLVAQRVSGDTLLIIPNTQPKQVQFKEMMIRTFYLSNAKAKDVLNLVKTMLDSKRVYVDEDTNAILVRDEADKVLIAERMIHAIDRRDPEVLLDVEVLEVNRTKTMKYGLDFAKRAGFGVIPSGSTGGVSTGLTTFTFEQLANIGSSSFLYTLPASFLMDFFKQESDAKTLASPKIRVLNNKSASVNVGDKQPILLSTTNVLPGQAATGAVPTTSTVTSIEFKDIGVKLTVEPTIHLTNELTLKLKVEVTSLGDQVTLQSSPEIKQFRFGTRTAETVLMMKDEETVVMAGLLQDQQRKTRSTVPWLGDIPFIGSLFGTNTQDNIQTEVVLTITPHIIRNLDIPRLDEHGYWSGTETNYSLTRQFSQRTAAMLDVSRADRTMVAATDRTSSLSESGPSPKGEAQSATVQLDKTGAPLQKQTATAKQASEWTLLPLQVTESVGKEFFVTVNAGSVSSDEVIPVILHYDPMLIEFISVAKGEEEFSVRRNPGQLILSMQPTGKGREVAPQVAQFSFRGTQVGESRMRLQQIVKHPEHSGEKTPATQEIIVQMQP